MQGTESKSDIAFLLVVLYTTGLVLWFVWFVVMIPRSNQTTQRFLTGGTAMIERALDGVSRYRRSVDDIMWSRDRSNGRVDCATNTRYCAIDDDCALLCVPHGFTRMRCGDRNVCAISIDDAGDGDGGDEPPPQPPGDSKRCDGKNGEYALLVGYTTLGTARWECVQFYQPYEQRESFCESGNFDMNALVREPSYRDCTCPEGTIRATFEVASAYDTGLPHCVDEKLWFLVAADMTRRDE